jgi:hypothetical protein
MTIHVYLISNLLVQVILTIFSGMLLAELIMAIIRWLR